MKTHQERSDEQDATLEGMTAMEALKAGLVIRTRPYFVCGALSPETKTPCELEPGHGMTMGHQGNSSVLGGAKSVWA